ncbi:unnamed protein product [Malus baccata var. baccata]
MTSPTVKFESILGVLTIKLNDTNYSKWVFQFKAILQGYKLFDHFDGSSVCLPKFVINIESGVTREISYDIQEWEIVDLALLSLLIATLSDDAIEHVLGCKTAKFQTLQKGSDSIDKFLSRLKSISDQLLVAGEHISENDFIIVALVGLPKEYAIIQTVILAREITISLKEFHVQLLNIERDIETMEHTLSNSMATMYVQSSSSQVFPNQ